MTTVTADELTLAVAAMTEARALLAPERLFNYATPPQWEPSQIGPLLARLEMACIYMNVALSRVQVKVEA